MLVSSVYPPLSLFPIEKPIVIIGAGLAGVCAAFEAEKRGKHVIIIDKDQKYPFSLHSPNNIALLTIGVEVILQRPLLV